MVLQDPRSLECICGFLSDQDPLERTRTTPLKMTRVTPWVPIGFPPPGPPCLWRHLGQPANIGCPFSLQDRGVFGPPLFNASCPGVGNIRSRTHAAHARFPTARCALPEQNWQRFCLRADPVAFFVYKFPNALRQYSAQAVHDEIVIEVL